MRREETGWLEQTEEASARTGLSWTEIGRGLDRMEKSGDGWGLVAEMHTPPPGKQVRQQGNSELGLSGRPLRKAA